MHIESSQDLFIIVVKGYNIPQHDIFNNFPHQQYTINTNKSKTSTPSNISNSKFILVEYMFNIKTNFSGAFPHINY